MNINKLKRVVIKEEYVAITGDMMEAIILNQFVYWSERSKDFDKFIKEEKERFKKFGNNTAEDEPNMDLTFGWIYKKAVELKDEIMSTDSEKTINRKLTSLVKKGFLDRRNNPKIKYDRTYQYRVNFENIIIAMVEKGYMIQDYKVDLNFIAEALKTDKGQIDDSNKKDGEESKGQIDALKKQIDALKNQIVAIKKQGVGAIPEITIETTSNTITEKETEETEPPITPTQSIQEKFYELMLKDISEVSVNTWIKALDIHIKENLVDLEAPDNFKYDIVKKKYLDIIEKNFMLLGINEVILKVKE